MRRLIIAIILGLVFPVVGFIALGFVSDYLPAPLSIIRINREAAPGILLAPFSIPIYIETILRQKGMLPQRFGVSRFWYTLAFIIIFNWILYGSIFYMLLGYLKRFKNQLPTASDMPPAPPTFEQKD